jgi:hypothetical protein
MDADMVWTQVNLYENSLKYQMRSIMVIPGALSGFRVILLGDAQEWSLSCRFGNRTTACGRQFRPRPVCNDAG